MSIIASVRKNGIDKRHVSMIERVFHLSLTSYFAANLITVLGSIIDGIIVGNTMGEDAITAVSFGSPVVIICSAIGTTVSVGFQNHSLKSLSRGDREAAGKALTETLIIGVLISLIVIMLTFSYMGTIVYHLGIEKTDSAYLPCVEYIKGMVVGLPAMTVMAIFARGTHVEGRHREAGIAVVVMAGINLLGDLVCAKLLHTGLYGITLGTSFSYLAGAAVLAYSYTKPDILIRPSIDNISVIDTFRVSRLGMWAGIVAAIYNLSLFLRAEMTNVAIDLYGTGAAGMRAYNVQVQLNYIVVVFMSSAMDAMFLIGGMFCAEEDRSSFKLFMHRVVRYEITITAAISLLILLLSDNIAALYLGNVGNASILTTKAVLRAYALGLTFQMIVLVFANYIQVFGHGFIACIVFIFANVIMVPIGLGYGNVIANEMNADRVIGCFNGLLVVSILTVLALPLMVPFVNRGLSGREYAWMMPKDFGVSPEDELRAVISSEAEVTEFSQRAWKFCENKGESEKLSYLASLAVEEMANSILQQELRIDDERHYLSVRLVYKKNELIIRMRDNCRNFDPRAKYEYIFENSDPEKMIGVKMIMSKAEDVRYTSLLDMNNLLIRIRSEAADTAGTDDIVETGDFLETEYKIEYDDSVESKDP